MTMCAECGRAPAAAGRRVCDDCLEAFVTDRMRRLGLPPGGRDPAEVDHELACRRGAVSLLLGKLTDSPEDQTAGMTAGLAECYERPGLTPAAALVPVLVNIPACLLVGAARDRFADRLREAGMIAAAEAEVADDAELEADGWRLAESLAAQHNATPPGLLLGPVLGLINDHVHDMARERLVDALAQEAMLDAGPAPDTPEGLT
jgi:hypothetical protein